MEWVERGFWPCLAPANRMTSGEPFPLCILVSPSGKQGLCSFVYILALLGAPRVCVLVHRVHVLAIARVHPEFIFETLTHSVRGLVGGPSGGVLMDGTSALFKKTPQSPLATSST